MSTAVRFENVTKRFALERGKPRSFKEAFVSVFRQGRGEAERLLALDDVSFELEKGESLGFVGPNGTGKSTSLKLIARILQPSSGSVHVDGNVAALLELGAGFHPDLTGRENIFLNGSMMGYSRKSMAKRLSKIKDFSELGRFIEMPVKHYSSGMYMRLGFATAVHLDAEILLIDEVLAVGDQAFQSKCRDRITDMRKAGVTIALVSHDNDAIRDLCSKAIWLEDGRVQGYGDTDEVIEDYYASMVAREEARLKAERAAETSSEDESEDETPVQRDRWGSGEVEVRKVEFLDGEGNASELLYTGRPAIFRVHYLAKERIESPVFGLAIHTTEGTHISGPNSKDASLKIEAVQGEGWVDYRVESLPLMQGRYEFSASCYDASCSHPYDHHHRRFTFHVRASTVRERYGLMYMPASWMHQPAEGKSSRAESKIDMQQDSSPEAQEKQNADPA